MDAAIVLFTRDLRVQDNPALSAACSSAGQVVPVFVADPAPTVPPQSRAVPGAVAGRPPQAVARARR
jgi:deoxyribodipyrimidine photo-lyase